MADILVAGASRGIGLGLAQRYLELGHTVHALARNPDASAPLQALARAHPGTLKLIEADITAADVVDRVAASLGSSRLGRLIVNAGIKQPEVKSFFDLSDEQIAGLFLTNAIAPVRLARALADRVEQGGVIAFLSSQMGSVALALSARIPLYGASKAALNSLVQSWASELGEPPPYALLALHPGWVRTDMGGGAADIDVEESVAGLVDTIESYADAPACTFVDYRNQPLAW